jgi:glutamyl-tRNA synthetase
MANISIDIIISELEKLNPNWGEGQSNQYKNDVLSLTKDRSKTLTDLMEISDTFFIDHVVYDMGIKDKIWNEVSSQIIDDLLSAINIEDNFDKQTLESIFENLMNQHDLSLGKLMQPVRFALSGLTYGPGIFDTMLLLGKDTCVKRLSESMKELS